MHLPQVNTPAPEQRRKTKLFYPVYSVTFDPADLTHALQFVEGHDHLDALESAYFEADGVPVRLQRRPNDPYGAYTLFIDAQRLSSLSDASPFSFALSVLVAIGIAPDTISWRNEGLGNLFPSQVAVPDPQDEALQLSVEMPSFRA